MLALLAEGLGALGGRARGPPANAAGEGSSTPLPFSSPSATHKGTAGLAQSAKKPKESSIGSQHQGLSGAGTGPLGEGRELQRVLFPVEGWTLVQRNERPSVLGMQAGNSPPAPWFHPPSFSQLAWAPIVGLSGQIECGSLFQFTKPWRRGSHQTS
jgi:hypothetical protein